MTHIILGGLGVVFIAMCFYTIGFQAGRGDPAQPSSNDTPASSSESNVARTVALKVSGSGMHTTQKISLTSDWDLKWSFDCSNFGMPANFAVDTKERETDAADIILNQSGKYGKGVEHLHNGGDKLFLEVVSECNWSIEAVNNP
jgi:hypothetical protein